ncbi:MAG: HAMP domain-containing histidine kinase [Anaerolineae bacterium]|nr:HAMP domain-containing histidine kinase [Anaerolineae bacterium]
MSIRLRLTLLYTSIVALTIVTFSIVLYTFQSQATLETTKASLLRQGRDYANMARRMPPPRHEVMPPMLANVPGRWTQVRSLDGTVIRRSADLSDTTLPLSDAGWRAVQSGAPWFETAIVDDEPLLIYSQLVGASERTAEIVQIAAPISERENALAILRMLLIAGDTLILLAAFAIGWTLAGAALEPIHRITQTAQSIGAARDFRQRIVHRGPNDEIGQLAAMLNTMLGELESAYRQVQQALEVQKRFVADASHELRTPLTTIRGNIELLRNDVPLDPSERAEVLADTKAEVERLIRLVNQLLWLARADAARSLSRESVALQPLIEQVCRQTKLLAPQRTILTEGIHAVSVWADRDALKQVLLILLDNARVHTPARATIRVTTTLEPQHVAIIVQDTGPGIPADVLPHVFERFYRGDPARHAGGAGLGLAIAKELIEAQGGTISVQSTVGQGSAFTITLPRAFATSSE